jgi:uncharacterized repeat protein (TIGR03803 family)
MRKTHVGILVCVAVLVAVATPVAAHAQTFSVLYNFNASTSDPLGLVSPGTLAQGQNGNIYTTSVSGGAFVSGEGANGTVFDMTPGGILSELYSFEVIQGVPAIGCNPYSGATLGTDGNVYGTTVSCGTVGYGTVFVITPSGSLAALYNFTGGSDGGNPYAAPIQGADGNYYGTTSCGGAQACPGGYGTVYKVTPSGTFTTLYQFDLSHGYGPVAPLVQGTDGNFYGTTESGGISSTDGVVFKITSSGKLTVLYNFDGTHGRNPLAPLIQGVDGNLYGTTEQGGSKGYGVIFKMTTSGKLTVLHNFNISTLDGGNPVAGLVQATDNNFYGVAEEGGEFGGGIIFRVGPTGGSSYSVRYHLNGATDGTIPEVTLLQHTNGLLYGLSDGGGTYGVGTFFSLSEGLGQFVSLVSTSGKVKASVEILGQGFTGTTGVTFNGTAATYTVVSDTYLTATVPSGATTGSVTVVTPGGTLASNKTFRIKPSITSFSPPSGPVGTSVAITGVSLTQTTKVTFGAVTATSFTVNSDKKVTATVPTGAKTGKIVITTAGGTATSAGTFTVTP